MANNNYKFIGSILVKFDKSNIKFNLAEAEQFGGPIGSYRVYKNRRWLEGFYTKEALLELLKNVFQGENLPPFKKGDRVKHYNYAKGLIFEMTIVSGDPIQAVTGEWLVPVVGEKGYIEQKYLRRV